MTSRGLKLPLTNTVDQVCNKLRQVERTLPPVIVPRGNKEPQHEGDAVMKVALLGMGHVTASLSDPLELCDVGVLHGSRLPVKLARAPEHFDKAVPQHRQLLGGVILPRWIKGNELVQQNSILVYDIWDFIGS